MTDEPGCNLAHPVKVDGRHVMDPSPIPKFDNPKMHRTAALKLFKAGREKRIYAIPPHTGVVSLDFEDHPFEVQTFGRPCALCGGEGVYLDEVITDHRGGRRSSTTPAPAASGRSCSNPSAASIIPKPRRS